MQQHNCKVYPNLLSKSINFYQHLGTYSVFKKNTIPTTILANNIPSHARQVLSYQSPSFLLHYILQ